MCIRDSAKADEQISCTEPEVCQRLAYTAHDRKASALFARRKTDLLYVQVLFFQLAFQLLAIQFVTSFFRDTDCAPVTRQEMCIRDRMTGAAGKKGNSC